MHGGPSSPPMSTTPLRSNNGNNVTFVGSTPSSVVRAGGLAAIPRQLQQGTQRPTPQPIKPSPPIVKNVKFADCPNCKERIPFIGANFYVHLYKCNSEVFARVVTNGEVCTSFCNVW